MQQYLQQKQIQYRFDLKEKGNYKPLYKRKERERPTTWKDLQKIWPSVNWDNEVEKLNLEELPEEDKKEATNLLEEIANYWQLFKSNMRSIKGKRIPRNHLVKYPMHLPQNIKEILLICMSDATGGTRYALMGAVAYLRYSYKDGSFGWQFVAASSKIATGNSTIVVRELKALRMSTELAKRVTSSLNL